MSEPAYIPKKRGRPAKLDNEKKKQSGRWNPKKWRSHYDTIVLWRILGLDLKSIQSKLKDELGLEYTIPWISNILNTPQGKVVEEIVRRRLLEKQQSSIEDNLSMAAKAASENIRSVMTDSELLRNSPISVGALSLKVLEGAGKLESGNKGGIAVAGNAIILSSVDSASLIDGLKKADQVKELHSNVSGVSIEHQKRLPSLERFRSDAAK